MRYFLIALAVVLLSVWVVRGVRDGIAQAYAIADARDAKKEIAIDGLLREQWGKSSAMTTVSKGIWKRIRRQ